MNFIDHGEGATDTVIIINISRGGEAVANLQSADVDRLSNAARGALAEEQRDTERAITLWQTASELDSPPTITALGLSRIAGDWGYRFLISGDQIVADAVFLLYGRQFARVLGLPAQPSGYTPLLQQLPGRYRPLFTEGCREAVTQTAPVRFSGAALHQGKIEFYRAVFMPFRLCPDSPRPLIYGSFNYRSLPEASTPAMRRRIDAWQVERV
jgi:hypothetical protein